MKNLLIGCLILLIISMIIERRNNIESEKIEKIDTIENVIEKIDTIIIDNPTPQYITKKETIRDTLKTTDTIPQLVEVEIPIERKEYKDSTYYVLISGYKANLEHIEIYPKQVIKTREIERQTLKNERFTYGLQGGIGYGLINQKPDIFIGIGVQYKF